MLTRRFAAETKEALLAGDTQRAFDAKQKEARITEMLHASSSADFFLKHLAEFDPQLAKSVSSEVEGLGRSRDLPGYRQAVSAWEKTKIDLLSFVSASRRAEHWIRGFDGGSARGVGRRYLWNRVSDAATAFRVAKKARPPRIVVQEVEMTVSYRRRLVFVSCLLALSIACGGSSATAPVTPPRNQDGRTSEEHFHNSPRRILAATPRSSLWTSVRKQSCSETTDITELEMP
jgi:hypothetical protein